MNVKVTGVPAVKKPNEGLTVGGEMTVAAEADVTEALSAPTTTAGTSRRFQCITVLLRWRQLNSFRL